MTRGLRPIVFSAAVSMILCLIGTLFAAGQAQPAARAPMAEDVFTNVRVLRGIPVDEFMGTMGFFSAALGMSCEDCHGASDTTWENYARDVSPKKATARRMIQMMTSINQASFGGRMVVTCYTCHRGSARPKVTPSLAALYGATLLDDMDDVIPAAKGGPSVDQVLDKYLQAIGGAQRLAGLTSVVGKGTSAGYGPEGTRPIEIFAKAPNQRTMTFHTLDGDSTTTYDGRVGVERGAAQARAGAGAGRQRARRRQAGRGADVSRADQGIARRMARRLADGDRRQARAGRPGFEARGSARDVLLR